MSTLKAINLQHPSATNPAIVLATDGSAAGNFSSSNGGPLAGFRNRIINGNFDFWQRGTSFSVTSTATYTADRWQCIFDGSGATRTISRQSFTLGQTDVLDEPTYFARYAQTVAGSGATFNNFEQRIEGVRTFAGKQVTISFYAKAATSFTLPKLTFGQAFGTGGSPTVFTDFAASTTITTSFAKYSYTVNIPSISGKTLGSGNDDFLSVIFSLPLNATFTVDIAQVQLEPGAAATPFERRPIGTELALCQRYFESGIGKIAGYGFNGVGNANGVYFKATKRVTPILTYAVGSATNVAIFDIRNPAVSGAEWFAQTGANTGYVWTGTWTASAEL